MARSSGTISESLSVQVFTCGECSFAYGFCLKGADGLPICCRCSYDGRYLRMCSHESCGLFDRRPSPLPTEFSFGISEPREDRRRMR